MTMPMIQDRHAAQRGPRRLARSPALARGAWLLAVLALPALLGGCLGGSSGRERTALFDLQTAEQATLTPQRPHQLAIAEPRTGQLLDSNRILVRPQPGEVRVYAGASWRDPTPRMLQEAVLRAFEDAGAFAAVGRQGSGLRGELLLLLDLRRFESVYASRDGEPHVEVELQATLLRGARGSAIGSTRIEARQQVDGTAAADVVAALGVATSEAIDRLVRWTHEQAPESLD